MENMIRAVIKEPGENAEIKMIPNELRHLQKLVGGLIECVRLKDCVVICNKEGLLLGLDWNTVFDGQLFFGNIVAVSSSGGDFASLDERTAQKIAVAMDKGTVIV